MSDNDNNQQSEENVGSTETESILEQERTRKGREIIAVTTASEKISESYSAKQTILHRLYKEQIVASDNFTTMNTMKGDYYAAIGGDIIFMHIDEEQQHLLTLLEDFEEKLGRSGKIVRDFMRDMRVHVAKLKKALCTVSDAKAVEDMADVNVPNLEWVESVPDPEIDELADEWDQMQLVPQTNQLMIELNNILNMEIPE